LQRAHRGGGRIWSEPATVKVIRHYRVRAASFSYQHALDVVGEHTRQTWMNNAFPLTVDGLIYAGSMVLLNDARPGLRPQPQAHVALGHRISAALTVNVTSGPAARTASREGHRALLDVDQLSHPRQMPVVPVLAGLHNAGEDLCNGSCRWPRRAGS
jgi:hypothetical protein